MTRDEFIQALRAAGVGAAAATQAATELERAGALGQASPALVGQMADALRRNTGPSASTAANVALRELEKYQKVYGKPKAPAKAPTSGSRTPTSAGGGALGGGGGSEEQRVFTQRVIDDAWRLLRGEWDPNIVPNPAIVEAARGLKKFVDGLGQQQPAEPSADPFAAVWDDLLGAMGGGGGGGGGVVGGYGGPAEDPVDTPEEIDAYARQQYGYLAAYLDDPEIGPILKQAAREGWDQGRLRGALANTNWWKGTSQTAREFDAEKNMDPASWQEKVNTRLEEIRRQAALMGLSIAGKVDLGGFGSYDRDYHIAVQSLREGWDPQRIVAALFKESDFQLDRDYSSGMIASQADQIKALARSYMLPTSDAFANSYAQAILSGTSNLDSVEAVFRDMAKGRFPGMAAMIDGGVRPEQFFDTYKQQAAQLLEIDPDQIDLLSPKWSPLVEVVGQDGTRRPMTLAESADYLRSLPEYDRTDNAMQEASRVADLLGKTFGKVG